MVAVAFLLLLIPGLVSIYVQWRNRAINLKDYKTVLFQYFAFTLSITILVHFSYLVVFGIFDINFFALITRFFHHIQSTRFIVVYSLGAFGTAVALPFALPRIKSHWQSILGKMKDFEKRDYFLTWYGNQPVAAKVGFYGAAVIALLTHMIAYSTLILERHMAGFWFIE